MAFRRSRIVETLFPVRVTQWFGPVAALGAAALLGAVLVVTTGILDLSASVPHPEGWAQFLHFTFRTSVDHHSAGIEPPAGFNTPAYAAKGAAYYGMACSHCHGAPGLGQNPVALSMMPRPQYLPAVASGFGDRQLFWIVRHGVKYSAMPSWPAQDRDDEVWSIVAFLRQLPKLTTAQYAAMAFGDGCEQQGVGKLAAAFQSHPYRLPKARAAPNESSYTAPAAGFDNFAAESDPVVTCARCHGADGAGRPGGAFPNIALLDTQMFRAALTAYADGSRHSAFMQNVAVQLSAAQIDALGTYYAAKPKVRSASPSLPGADPALGERIATGGVAGKRVGACANCHDVTKAAAKLFPAIDGQNALYLRDQLRLYRSGFRGRSPADPMAAEAKPMSDAEIDAVSSWYAARQPGPARVVAVNVPAH